MPIGLRWMPRIWEERLARAWHSPFERVPSARACAEQASEQFVGVAGTADAAAASLPALPGGGRSVGAVAYALFLCSMTQSERPLACNGQVHVDAPESIRRAEDTPSASVASSAPEARAKCRRPPLRLLSCFRQPYGRCKVAMQARKDARCQRKIADRFRASFRVKMALPRQLPLAEPRIRARPRSRHRAARSSAGQAKQR